MFFNYLNIEKKTLESNQMIILFGRSGSGKSTYANYIHRNDSSFYIVDEIWSLSQIFKLFYLVIKNQKIVVASHKNKSFYFCFKLFRKISFYNLDENPDKIKKELELRGITYSDKSIQTFFSMWKTSYVDLDIVLEKSKKNSFDEILNKFINENSIVHKPKHIQIEFKSRA